MTEKKSPVISFKNFTFQYRAQKRPTLMGSIWTFIQVREFSLPDLPVVEKALLPAASTD